MLSSKSSNNQSPYHEFGGVGVGATHVEGSMADAARIDDRDHPGLIQQLVRPGSTRIERDEVIARQLLLNQRKTKL